MKLVGLTVVPCLLLALNGCTKESSGKPEEKSSKVSSGASDKQSRKFDVITSPVKKEHVIYEIEAVGSLVEENRFEIPARLAGVAENVAFSEGDEVTSGQELCRIDFERYQLLFQQAQNGVEEKKAAVLSAEANLRDLQRETSTSVENAKVALELAEGEYRRRAVAATSAFTSSEEQAQYEARYKQAQTSYRDAVSAVKTRMLKAETDLDSEQAAYSTAISTLALAKNDLDRSIVKAPVDGIIQQRSTVNGQYMAMGDTVAMMIQSKPLRLKFTVPESRAARLQKSMLLNFTVPAYPERTFTAKIYDIGAFADNLTREVVCWARVGDDQADLLKPGYFTKVQIQTESRNEAIVVPLISVQPTEKGMIAYVVKDGTAQRRILNIGMQVTGDSIEVLSGLEPGELLVVEGGNALRDGVPVNLVSKKTEAAFSEHGSAGGVTSGSVSAGKSNGV